MTKRIRAVGSALFGCGVSSAPAELTPDPEWRDWQRDPGKSGRDDAVCDLEDARWIRIVRSGVAFLQAPDMAVGFGPLKDNL